MILGAIASLTDAGIVSWLLRRYKPPAFIVTLAAMPVWFMVSFALLTVLVGPAH
jgi:ABC-type xylose transport system permease subunit